MAPVSFLVLLKMSGRTARCCDCSLSLLLSCAWGRWSSAAPPDCWHLRAFKTLHFLPRRLQLVTHLLLLLLLLRCQAVRVPRGLLVHSFGHLLWSYGVDGGGACTLPPPASSLPLGCSSPRWRPPLHPTVKGNHNHDESAGGTHTWIENELVAISAGWRSRREEIKARGMDNIHPQLTWLRSSVGWGHWHLSPVARDPKSFVCSRS